MLHRPAAEVACEAKYLAMGAAQLKFECAEAWLSEQGSRYKPPVLYRRTTSLCPMP
jgi:hypothetical protein